MFCVLTVDVVIIELHSLVITQANVVSFDVLHGVTVDVGRSAAFVGCRRIAFVIFAASVGGRTAIRIARFRGVRCLGKKAKK